MKNIVTSNKKKTPDLFPIIYWKQNMYWSNMKFIVFCYLHSAQHLNVFLKARLESIHPAIKHSLVNSLKRIMVYIFPYLKAVQTEHGVRNNESPQPHYFCTKQLFFFLKKGNPFKFMSAEINNSVWIRLHCDVRALLSISAGFHSVFLSLWLLFWLRVL